MDGYLTQDRLTGFGPKLFFDKAPFLERMTLREIHTAALADYRRAVGKFGKPARLWGKEHHVHKEYTVKDEDLLVVEILPTPYDLLLKWDTISGNDVLTPRWKVRTARDPGHVTRNLKELLVSAPQYTLGKMGTNGPFLVLTADKRTLLSH